MNFYQVFTNFITYKPYRIGTWFSSPIVYWLWWRFYVALECDICFLWSSHQLIWYLHQRMNCEKKLHIWTHSILRFIKEFLGKWVYVINSLNSYLTYPCKSRMFIAFYSLALAKLFYRNFISEKYVKALTYFVLSKSYFRLS